MIELCDKNVRVDLEYLHRVYIFNSYFVRSANQVHLITEPFRECIEKEIQRVSGSRQASEFGRFAKQWN